MYNHDIKKSDWKLFRSKIGTWQENYMDKLNKEYIALLSGDGAPSEKFWNLYNRLKEDKKKPGVLIQLTRSDLIDNIAWLIRSDAITFDDLDGFSDELKDRVKRYLGL